MLLQHPVTTEIELNNKHITEILKAIYKIKKSTIAIAPNSDAGSKIIFDNIKKYSQKYTFINVFPSIPRSDYLGMLKNCGVLVGNSSSGIIEASCFDTPIVNLGIRQKGRERRKGIIDVPQITAHSVYDAMLKGLALKKNNKVVSQSVYGKGDASKKIIKYLENIKLNKELIQKQIYY